MCKCVLCCDLLGLCICGSVLNACMAVHTHVELWLVVVYTHTPHMVYPLQIKAWEEMDPEDRPKNFLPRK